MIDAVTEETNQTRKPSSNSLAIVALIVSITLFSLGAPLVKWLIQNGESIGVAGHNAISFCNVLFVGNLSASLIVLLFFGAGSITRGLRKTTWKTRRLLMGCGFLALFSPALLVVALQHTSATNVVLLSRLGPVFYAIVEAILNRRRLTVAQWVGYSFIILSLSAVTVIGEGGVPNFGDLLIVVAGVCYCISAIANRYGLEQAGTPAFVFSRNFIAAIAFGSIAVVQFGWQHFADLVQPQLWLALFVYALIAIALAQLAWFFALERVSSSTIGSMSVISPATGLLFAWLLVHERPEFQQWMALGLLLVGIGIANLRGAPKGSASKQTTRKRSAFVSTRIEPI